MDGRSEKRVTMLVPVCLVEAEKLLVEEEAMTVNVSPHGARVITRRRWQPQERPQLAHWSGGFQTYAKVVYCEPLPDGRFCVGLKLQSPIEDWKTT